jgi:hypothetical protein
MSLLYLRCLFDISKKIYEHKDIITSVPIKVKINTNTPCRDEVKEVLENLSPGLVDNELSLSLTRALGKFISFDGNTSSIPYTPDEFRLALSFVVSGGKKIDAMNQYGIPKQTLATKLNEIHDIFNLEHGKNGALEMQQLCINESANVNKALFQVLQSKSGFSSLINKYEADLLNRLLYLGGRTGNFLFVTIFLCILILFAI